MNPLNKLKKKKAIEVLPDEIRMLLKFSKWIDYDLSRNGNLESKKDYQVMNDWLANYVKNNFSIDRNIVDGFKNEKEFIKFGFKMAQMWDKESLRDMKMFTAHKVKVVNNKYTMVRK